MDLTQLFKSAAASIPGIGTYYGLQNKIEEAAKSKGNTYDYDWIPGVNNSNNSGQGVLGDSTRFNFTNNSTSPTTNEGGGGNTGQSNDQVVYGSDAAQAAAQRAAQAADERAYYDDTIAQIDRLLGGIGYQTQAGLENLQRSLANERTKLENQKKQTLQGYDDQSLQNAQDKQRGVEQVDSYANQNYNSLQRLLQGANAGSSSVARELVPYLVSKAAGTRRTSVFDTAGRNEQSIVSARKNAEDQYTTAFGELEDQGKQQEQQFRQSILNQENDLLAQKQEAEMKRAMANGSGYLAARAASRGTRDSINSRQDQLNNLFSQFKPTFQQKALDFQKPELGQYTVDRAAVNAANSGLPTESSYYLSQLKRKQEEGIR